MTDDKIRICNTNCKNSDGNVYTSNPPCIYCTLIDFFHQQGEPCGVQIEVQRLIGSIDTASMCSLNGQKRKEE